MNLKVCAITVIAFAIVGSVLSENVPSDDAVKKLIDDLDAEQSLPVFGGLSLDKIEASDEVSPRSSESLTDRLIRYVRSHRVNFDLSEERSDVGGKIKPVHIIKKKVKSTFKHEFLNFIYIKTLFSPNYLIKETLTIKITKTKKKCVTARHLTSPLFGDLRDLTQIF